MVHGNAIEPILVDSDEEEQVRSILGLDSDPTSEPEWPSVVDVTEAKRNARPTRVKAIKKSKVRHVSTIVDL